MVLSGSRLAVTNSIAEFGSFWTTLGNNKSYYRILVALSSPRLAVTYRTAESWWLFLAHVRP